MFEPGNDDLTEKELAELAMLDRFFEEFDEPPRHQVPLHPHPVAAKCCGTILQATYAEQNNFLCPGCGARACYTCGCTDGQACTRQESNGDGTATQTYHCWWQAPGACGFCLGRAAYELYMAATNRPADDPHYLEMAPSSFGVKGLAYGV